MYVIPKNYGVFSSKTQNFNILPKWPKHLVVKRPLPASGIFDGSTSKPPVSPRLRSRGEGDPRVTTGGGDRKKKRVPDSFYEIAVVMVKISQNPYIVWVGISIPRHVPNKQPPFGPFLYISQLGKVQICHVEMKFTMWMRGASLAWRRIIHSLKWLALKPLKMDGWKMIVSFLGRLIFRGDVSGRVD